jgi:hypothetical protein
MNSDTTTRPTRPNHQVPTQAGQLQLHGEVKGTPGDRADGGGAGFQPCVSSAGVDELAGVFGGAEQVGVDDPDGRGSCRLDGMVDGLCGGDATGPVVIEGKDDVVDTDIGEGFEEAAVGGGAAQEAGATRGCGIAELWPRVRRDHLDQTVNRVPEVGLPCDSLPLSCAPRGFGSGRRLPSMQPLRRSAS